MTMTRQEMAKNINANFSNLMFNLYERWQDEKEYEDFNDYVETFKKHIPETIKGLKRPFGFIVKCSDGNLKTSVKVQGKYAKLFYESAK